MSSQNISLKERLESHTVKTLKSEISKQNIKGVYKKGVTKSDIINMMLKYPKRFEYIEHAGDKKIKQPKQAPKKKEEPPKKKAEPKKPEPKKEPLKKDKPNNENFEKAARLESMSNIGVALNPKINQNTFLTGLKFFVYNILQDKDVNVNEPINYNPGMINSYFEYPINEKKSNLGNLTNDQKEDYLNILDEEYGLYIENKKFKYETLKKNEKAFNKFISTPFSKLMKESKEYIEKFRKINEQNKKDAEERLKKQQEEDKKKETKPEPPKEESLSDKFYSNLNTFLKGSSRGMRSLQKDYGFSKEEINKVFENQAYADFFPTPAKCLNVYDKYFIGSDRMLEGTAGLGSVVNYAQSINKDLDITANELSSDFIPIIKKFNPGVKTINKDYFKINNLHDFDLIFLNPPFSKGGRGGKKFGSKDSKFYYNFLFHTIINLNRFKEKNNSKMMYDLLFISPTLSDEKKRKEQKGDVILLENIYPKMGLNKLNEILKDNNIKEITKKQFNQLIEDGSIEDRFDIDELLEPIQIQYVSQCADFGGTGTTANQYIIII